MKLYLFAVKLSIHFCSATRYLQSKWPRRSVTSLSPSAVNKLSSSRNFLCDSELNNLFFAFDNIIDMFDNSSAKVVKKFCKMAEL